MSKNILSKSLGIVSNYKNIKRRYFNDHARHENSYIAILNLEFTISTNSIFVIELINIPTLLFLEYLGMMQSDIR